MDPRVTDVADLLTVEPLPLLLVEALDERDDVDWLRHTNMHTSRVSQKGVHSTFVTGKSDR